jgi:RluA family pseudouridine synthase
VNFALNILYQDDDAVAVNKPEGLAAVPECAHDPTCLAARLAAALGRRVWPVHRLDKDVSGVILYALNAAAHRALNGRFERREVRKCYRALVWGAVTPDAGVIDRPLREFGSGRMGVAADGKPSVTEFTVLERLTRFTLLEARPRTGRRHQIRAHFYALGHAIVGDPRYGEAAAQKPFARLMLHAAGLSVLLPSGRPLEIRACPSASFEAELARCRGLTLAVPAPAGVH